ncbi:MAG: DUF1549 domain-containing protein, partial [Verrucomicrobia bacterium]
MDSPPPTTRPGRRVAALPRWPAATVVATLLAMASPTLAADPPGAQAIVESAAKHWAFQTLRRPALPPVPAPEASNPVDRFVARGLRSAGIEAAGEADRATLVRRVAFTLTGLPPTPEQIADYVGDPR